MTPPKGDRRATRLQTAPRAADNGTVTLVRVPAPAAGPAPAGSSAQPRLTRPARATLAGLAAVAALVALAVPVTSPLAVPLLSLLVVPLAAAAIWRHAPATPTPRAWQLYGAGLLTSTVGRAVGHALGVGEWINLFGAPGQVLCIAGVVCMVDRAGWREHRRQFALATAIFVDAAVLTGASVYALLGVWDGHLLAGSAVLLALALGSNALRTGVALVLALSSPGSRAPAALLLLAGEVVISTGWVLSASRWSIDTPTADHMAPALGTASFLAGALLAVAAVRAAGRGGGRKDVAQSRHATLVAVLPHVTAAIAGSSLLVSIFAGHAMNVASLCMGVVGLGLISAHEWQVDARRQQLVSRLERSEAYFRTLARTSAAPILIVDDELRVSWCSPSLTDLLGPAAADLVGLEITVGVHREDLPGLVAALSTRQPAGATETRSRTARVRHSDGSWRLIEITARDLRDDPDVGAMVLYLRSVAAPRHAGPAAELEYADPETGLPTRSALLQQLTGALRHHPGTPRGAVALVTLTVTGLEDARTAGPDAEGRLRRTLVGLLSGHLRTDDWLAQRSGDSFAVVVSGTIAHAETLARRLVGAVATLSSGAAQLTALAGVLALPTDPADVPDAGELLRRVDLALAGARATGPGSVRRYDDALRAAQGRREQLLGDLERAQERGELRMVFQPIVDLALHRPAGVEALMRWEHPLFGAVSPADFIPLAEESSLITELGRWALREACAAVLTLEAGDAYVAVNVSARHVLSGQLLADVTDALAATGLPATRLVLEITESVLLDERQIIDDLAELRRLGVRIAVDDFGTGWSSLARLVSLPIDVLKMDRSFLTGLEQDGQRRSLCRSVLQLGSSLGLAVVVEGVETTMELQLLQDMGHRYVQGYLLGRPAERTVLAARVAAGSWTRPAVAEGSPS